MMSGWAASLEKGSTAPGLVVWSSSVTSSSCLPRTPPDLLTRSNAILAPASAYPPTAAAGPVTRGTMGAARLATSPAFRVRRLNLIRSSHGRCAWFRRIIRWPRLKPKLAEVGPSCKGAWRILVVSPDQIIESDDELVQTRRLRRG